MLLIKGENEVTGIMFPTSLSEISADVLKELTDIVKLPKYYSVIALCARVKLFDIATTVSGDKNPNFPVTNILAKFGEELKETIDCYPTDTVVIDRSSIERAIHLNIPCSINTKSVNKLLKNNPKLTNSIIKGQYRIEEGKLIFNDNNISKQLISSNSPIVYVIEFKIIPNNNIYGLIPRGGLVIDPFVVSDNNAN